MSSEVFESKEDEIKQICNLLKRDTSQKILKSYGEEKKRNIREAERKLEDATLLLSEMDMEAKKAPSPYRSQLMARIRAYRKDVDQIRATLSRAKSESSARDNLLFNRDEDDFESMSQNQNSRLQQGTDILNRTSASVARSQVIAAETDAVGHDIIDELGTQREALQRTKGRLRDTDEGLSQSRKVLNSMARRVMTNKLILIFIIVLELGVLAGSVYWKFFS